MGGSGKIEKKKEAAGTARKKEGEKSNCLVGTEKKENQNFKKVSSTTQHYLQPVFKPVLILLKFVSNGKPSSFQYSGLPDIRNILEIFVVGMYL